MVYWYVYPPLGHVSADDEYSVIHRFPDDLMV